MRAKWKSSPKPVSLMHGGTDGLKMIHFRYVLMSSDGFIQILSLLSNQVLQLNLKIEKLEYFWTVLIPLWFGWMRPAAPIIITNFHQQIDCTKWMQNLYIFKEISIAWNPGLQDIKFLFYGKCLNSAILGETLQWRVILCIM